MHVRPALNKRTETVSCCQAFMLMHALSMFNEAKSCGFVLHVLSVSVTELETMLPSTSAVKKSLHLHGASRSYQNLQ